jgi:hypothetical protein
MYPYSFCFQLNMPDMAGFNEGDRARAVFGNLLSCGLEIVLSSMSGAAI